MAAAGTPDPNPDRSFAACHVDSSAVALTGSRENCVSNFDVSDMVGNVAEWVEDWIQPNTGSNGAQSSNSDYGNDLILGIDDAFFQGGGAGFPAALVRGGAFIDGVGAGVFAVTASLAPSESLDNLGFRCAREL